MGPGTQNREAGNSAQHMDFMHSGEPCMIPPGSA